MTFSIEEVREINEYQKSREYHPLTCGNCSAVLIATTEGLRCPGCDYLQTWAHDWIKNGGWRSSW